MRRKTTMAICLVLCLCFLAGIMTYAAPEGNTKTAPPEDIPGIEQLPNEIKDSKWFKLGQEEGIYKHFTEFDLIGKSYLGESIEGILFMSEEIEGFNLKEFLSSSVCNKYTIEDFKGFKEQGLKTLMDIYEQENLSGENSTVAPKAKMLRNSGNTPNVGATQWGTITVTGSRMYENSDAPSLVGAFRNAGIINDWYISLFNIRLSGFNGDFAWLNGKTFNSVGNSAILGGDISSFVRCLTPKKAAPTSTMQTSCLVRITELDEAGSRIRVNLESSSFGSGYQAIGGPVYLSYSFPAPPPKDGYFRVQKSSAKPDLTNGNSAYDLKGAKFSVWSCNSVFTYEDWANKDTNGNPKGLSWQGNFITLSDGSVRRQSFVDDGYTYIDESNIGSVLKGKENGRDYYWYYEKNSSMMNVPVGSYGVVEEDVAGIYGYSVNHTAKMFNITEGNTSSNPVTVSFTNTPTLDPVDVLLGKVDRETNVNRPAGSASLAGAEFTVKYYPTLTNNVNGLTPKYTWVIITNERGVARIPQNQLPYITNQYGEREYGLPIGTLTTQETKAPAGYLIDNTVHLRQIKMNGEGTGVETYNMPIIQEQVIRGGFKMQKVDKDTNEAKPQGNAELNNATFTVTNASGQSVRVNGRDYANNAVCHTFTTDANGQYISLNDLLPYGTYHINETKASGGYLVNTGWSATVNIRTNGTIVDVTGNPVPEQVIRGGFKVQKVDKDTNGTTPQGNATLAGAQLEVINRSSQPVYTYMDGAWGMRQPNAVCYKITTGTNGIAQSPADALPYGAYRIREAQSSSGYLINSGWYVDFTVSQNGAIADLTATRLQQQVIRGGFKAQKVDRDTDKNVPLGSATLAGAELHVTNTSAHPVYTFMDGAWGLRQPGTVCCKIVTNENGIAQSSADALPYGGSYRIKEVKAPEGYLPNTEWYRDFSITQDGIIHDITNTPVDDQVIRGSLQLVKFREDSDKPIKNPLKDVEFTLTHKKTGEQVKIVTDENGYARTADNALVYGTWDVAETSAPAGYIPIQPFEINIERHNQIHYFIIENGTIRSAIRIIKTDKSTGNIIPLAGTEFRIRNVDKDEIVEFTTYYPNKETFTTIKTGADGTCFLPQMLEYGNYEAIEIKAPEGYMLNQTAVPFTVTENRDYTNPIVVFVENEPAKGKIKLEKTGDIYKGYSEMEHDVAGKILLPVFEPGKLAGAEFEIKAAQDIITPDGTVRATAGEVVDTIVTTEGEDFSKELYLDKYIVKETKAPEGYILDTTEYEVEITYQSGATEPTVTVQSVSNKWLEARIEIDKEAQELVVKEDGDKVYTEINVKPGEGFLFTLNTAGNIRDIPANSAVAYGYTDTYGKLVFEGKFPHGTYYVEELYTNEAYHHNDIKYPVDLTYSQDSVKIEVAHKVLNELKKKEVTINKTDITGENPVPGALIEISNGNGQVVYRDVTDEHGEIKDIILVPSKHTFKETLAPNGFALNTAVMEFEVTDELEVIGDTTIKDEYTKIIFKKVGINDNPLPGAKFGLFEIDAIVMGKIDNEKNIEISNAKELSENVIFQQEKTERSKYKQITYGKLIAKAISDENGIVTFEKILFGNYLVKELEAPEGYQMTDKVHFFTINGSYVNPSEPIETFVNTRIISISKTDITGEKPVAGATVEVYNSETGEMIYKGVTDEKGRVDNIPIPHAGKYYFKEVYTPSGFALNESTYEFEVTDKGEVIGNLSFANDITRMAVKKVNAETGEPLSGAEFTMYNDKEEAIQTAVTDENGLVEFSGMEYGAYTIEETVAPEGFVLEGQEIRIEVDDTWTNSNEPIIVENIRVPAAPKTGDNVRKLHVAAAGLIVAAGCGLYLIKKKIKK